MHQLRMPIQFKHLRRIAKHCCNLSVKLQVVTFIFLVAVALPLCSAQAQDDTSVMIVFDGSGSMWGRLEGERQHKLGLARKALATAIATTKTSRTIEAGLISFGHRRSRDCTDTGILRPLGPLSSANLLRPLKKLNPRGRGPLTRALRLAASQLAGSQTPASIILIHDGVDNCREDPCAFADEFAKSHPRTAVHVISLGLKPAEFASMACISRATGGRHFDVHNGAELTSVMRAAWALAVQASAAGNGLSFSRNAIRPGKTTDRPLSQTPEPAANFNGSGIVITAALASGGPTINASIHWKIRTAGNTSATPIHESTGPILSLALPPANYVIEADFGLLKARKTVMVPPAPALYDKLLFNAAALELTVSAKRGAQPLRGATIAIVRSSDADEGSSAGNSGFRPLLLTSGTDRQIMLPDGRYLVRARQGSVITEQSIDLKSGSRHRSDLVLNSGTLHLMVTSEEDKTQADNDIVFTISEIAPDAAGGKREIRRTLGPEAKLTLPAGTYFVTAYKGLAKTTLTVAIDPGHSVSKVFAVPSAGLQLATFLGARAAPDSQPLLYKITSLDRGDARPYRTSQLKPNITLAPGRYSIASRIGLANAVLVNEITLQAGKNEQLAVSHNAGLVRFRLTTAAGGLPLGQVYWTITDSNGAKLRQSGLAEPSEVLAAGSYIVTAEQRGRLFQKKFNVAAGDSKDIEIVIN